MGTLRHNEQALAGAITSETHCFGIFKPDAIEMGIVPDIEREIEKARLTILGRSLVSLTVPDVLVIWPQITTPHVSRTIPYMTQSPVELFMVAGNNASTQMLAIKRDFRDQYPSENPVISVIHTTDHDDELCRCVDHFFGGLKNA